MAERSGFFDAHLREDGKYDRTYLADSFAKYFASFIGNGVYGGKSSELMVRQESTPGMGVTVLSGQAFINGYWYENEDDLTLDIDIADGTLSRIDLVVVRWDNTNRAIYLAVKKGTPSANPVAPILQRNSDFYELKLAQIRIRAGGTSILDSDITDTRLNSEVCGFVQGLVKQFDTTAFGVQLESFIELFKSENTAKMQEVLDKLNSMADTNDIANLILDIENLKEEDAKVVSDLKIIEQTLGYTKKNLLPFPFVNTVGDVAEFAGVTWTDLGDGTVKGNGTASAMSYFTLYEGEIYLKPGKYILTSGFNDTTTAYVFFVKIHKTTGEYAGRVTSTQKLAIEITESDIENYNILISTFLSKGASLSNVIIRPMLRRAEILDDTWQPPVKSLKEVFENIAIEDEVESGCFYRIDPGTKIKRWINPPSKPGIEYCTTEMWNNKPVYQMTLYVAALPNKTVMGVSVDIGWDKVISINGFAQSDDDMYYYPFPIIINGLTPSAVITNVEDNGPGTGVIVIQSNEDLTYLKGYITVKYTKL